MGNILRKQNKTIGFTALTADQIPYGSGSVEQGLDGIKATIAQENGIVSSAVDITSYTSSSNKYTIPRSGYIKVVYTVTTTSSNSIHIYLNDVDNQYWCNNQCKLPIYIPVSKGDTAYFTCQSNASYTAHFIPQNNSPAIPPAESEGF